MTNRYDELSDRARWFLNNFDDIDLADICASHEASNQKREAIIERVRKVIAERRIEVAEREEDGMLPFGTPGASWCDAVTVTCDRIDDALRFPNGPQGFIRCENTHNDGPSVREAAADDRRWPLEKAGE